ncbi:MAG: TolC family protein [Deltaproteobacteria bacterium]|nr:TolC family protein [Deltaproteobacteria bacterium]
MLPLLFLLAAAAPAPDLTLPRAMELALAGDPSLAADVERVAARHASAAFAWAPFMPMLTVRFDATQRQDPIAGPFFSYFQPEATVDSQVLRGGLGVRGLLPVGTTYELSVDQSVGYYSSVIEALNPRLEPGLRLRLTQPLWRDLSPAATLAAVGVASARVGVAEAEALARRDQVLLGVAEGWLDAVLASGVVALRKQSIDLANTFEKLTRQRIEGGEQSTLDLALALQTVSQREVALARAAAQNEAALAALAQLLYAPNAGAGAGTEAGDAGGLDPAPLGVWPAPDVSAQEATTRAAARSPALSRLRALSDAATAEAARAGDAGAPDIRVGVEGHVRGLAGTSTCQGGYLADGLTPCGVDPSYIGGYDRAYASLGEGRFYSVGVVVTGEIPVWPGPAGAAGLAARHEQAALAAETRAEELRVAAESGRRVRAAADAARVLAAATKSVSLAAAALSAEETKLAAGRSTGFDLTRAQELLIGARIEEFESKVALARAQLRLRAMLGELGPEHGALYP